MLMHTIYKVMASLLVLAGLSLPVTAVYANDVSTEIEWILIGDTVHLDRSTRYLMNGLERAGIRHAEKALRRDGSALNQLIANHNLCLGLVREGEIKKAKPYCQTLSRLPVPQLSLEQVKPGLYKTVTESGHGTGLELKTVIAGNLAFLDNTKDLSQLVKMDVVQP